MSDTRVYANAAKAVIVDGDGRVLFIRCRPNDVHRPGEWDIPGGRLEPGEDPYAGVRRETKEETSLDITVGQVLDVHHFTRQDGQVITMMIFACTPQTHDVRLSEEHVEYRWAPLAEAGACAPEWFPSIIERYERWMRGR
ncbi:MAG: NUDIX domain-containing protein [bacterium]|nr:NUDIX domain-containing protein [bacterium]